MNNKDFANFLGITDPTLYNWKKNKPNLYKIVMDWKENQKTKKQETSKNHYEMPVVNIKASAGSGNELISIDEFKTNQKILIDKLLFKNTPKKSIRAIQVDGYSMTPMLYPDSWILFDEQAKYNGDGLYVINYQNILMVKLLQIDFANNKLKIISVNKDYQSWEVDQDNQEYFSIVGKVIRCII